MVHMHTDFHQDNKFQYEGSPTGETDGPAVVLVEMKSRRASSSCKLFGRKNSLLKCDRTILSFQTILLDGFVSVTDEFDEVDDAKLYSQKTDLMRIAQLSPLLERSPQQEGVYCR